MENKETSENNNTVNQSSTSEPTNDNANQSTKPNPDIKPPQNVIVEKSLENEK